MTKTRVILIISFLVTFAAGTAVGVLAGWSARPHGRGSRLARELDLTKDQREQMRKVWSEVMRGADRPQYEGRRAIREERDQAVQALMTEEQKPRYQEIMQEYSRKQAELSEDRKKRFREAVERTKEILTEPQREKYEEMLKKRRGRGYKHRRGNRESGRTGGRRIPHWEG